LHSSAESQLSPRTDCKITIFKRNKKISSELFAKIEKFQVSLPMAAFQAVNVYGYRYLQKVEQKTKQVRQKKSPASH